MTKLVNLHTGDIGSTANKGVSDFDKAMYSSRPGKMVISTSNSDRASAIIMTDDDIKITDSSTSNGILVNRDGITIQGTVYLTSKGKNIKKGEFSENPKSNKVFTYQETILIESVPIELVNEVAGRVGQNISLDGTAPIITDIAAGPLPHFHTISMKHVHRLEPGYLYRVPDAVGMVRGCMQSLIDFSKA
jgi:hypothetical protein